MADKKKKKPEPIPDMVTILNMKMAELNARLSTQQFGQAKNDE